MEFPFFFYNRTLPTHVQAQSQMGREVGVGGWMGGPEDLGKPSVDQSFWERALIWI